MAEFDELYIRHFKYVYKYVLSLCRNETAAEDITQEAFLKAFENIDGFSGKCKIQVWLCQIAKNTYFTYYESAKKHTFSSAELEWDSAIDFEQRFFDRENAFEVHKALHSLDEPYKEVFSLRFFGELPFSQIAELFGKTESWARVTYHRAKMKLKEDLS
ncbi:MAG: RNA polymerase sigma factor [Oscillospiraceae bacterium]|nr:RNA polymerase sigma factor [Oscillospiraceae bacterium]